MSAAAKRSRNAAQACGNFGENCRGIWAENSPLFPIRSLAADRRG